MEVGSRRRLDAPVPSSVGGVHHLSAHGKKSLPSSPAGRHQHRHWPNFYWLTHPPSRCRWPAAPSVWRAVPELSSSDGPGSSRPVAPRQTEGGRTPGQSLPSSSGTGRSATMPTVEAGTYRVSPCTHVMGSAVFWSGHGLTTEGWASVTELPESSTADIREWVSLILPR